MELEGTFMCCGVKNSNGRTYDSSIMQNAIADYQKKVAEGKAFGYLGDDQDRYYYGAPCHPNENIADISHKITEFNFDEETGKLFGKIQLLDTPRGKVAQTIVAQTNEMGVAASLAGEVDRDGTVLEVNEIFGFNLCNNPSWTEAKVKPVE